MFSRLCTLRAIPYVTVFLGFILCAGSPANGQTNYVLVQATENKVFLPYGLQQPIPFTDSLYLRSPSCTLAPEFEDACRSIGALDINRAFELTSESDTVRYGVAGHSADIGFMHRWYKVRIPDEISNIDFAQYLRDSIGLWAEPRIYASPEIVQQVEPTDALYQSYQKAYWGLNGDGPGWLYRLELPKAWAVYTGSPAVRVAIFDTEVIMPFR